MEVAIKAIVTGVHQSKKSTSQYMNLFDLEAVTNYTLVSKNVVFDKVPTGVPVEIKAKVTPRVFANDGHSSTVLYVEEAHFKNT